MTIYSRLSSSRSSPRLAAISTFFIPLLVSETVSSSKSSPISSEYAYLQFHTKLVVVYYSHALAVVCHPYKNIWGK